MILVFIFSIYWIRTSKPENDIEIERLLQKKIQTQPSTSFHWLVGLTLGISHFTNYIENQKFPPNSTSSTLSRHSTGPFQYLTIVLTPLNQNPPYLPANRFLFVAVYAHILENTKFHLQIPIKPPKSLEKLRNIETWRKKLRKRR